MTKSYTPRMALIKESDDELVDPYSYNWPIVDQFAGGIVVNNGVTPPTSQLFHGAIVCEATSGKQWIAKLLPNGTYEKQWLLYPWQCYIGGNVVINTTPGTSAEVVIPTWFASQSLNSTATDKQSGGIRLPAGIPGIYEITCSAQFNTNGTPGTRSAYISVDHNNDYLPNNMLREDSGGSYTMVNCTLIQKLNGNLITAKLWQNSGGLMNIDMALVATLISTY